MARERSIRALLPWALVLWSFVSAPLAAQVQIREQEIEGKTCYLFQNDFLTALVDPQQGGAVVALERGDAGEEPVPHVEGCTLARDAISGVATSYRVRYFVRSNSIAVLSMAWENADGLKVEKSFSLLEREMALRVRYRIANGSQKPVVIETRSMVPAGADAADEVRALERRGVRAVAVVKLRAGTSVELKRPSWVAVERRATDQELIAQAGPGLWDRVGLHYDDAQDAIVLDARSASIPAGKLMEERLTLLPVPYTPHVVAAAQGVVLGATVKTAGLSVRVKSDVVPIGDLDGNHVVVRFQGEGGEELSSLSSPPLQLTCGNRAAFAVFYEAPESARYRCELALPAQTQPEVLAAFTFVPDSETLQWLQIARAKLVLRDLKGWSAEPWTPVHSAFSPAVFLGPGGEELSALHLHVGVGEDETTVFELQLRASADSRPIFSVTELIDHASNRRVPPSKFRPRVVGREFLSFPSEHRTLTEAYMVLPATEDAEEGGQGRVKVALDFDSDGLEPGQYSGRLKIAVEGREASLPLLVRIWPVRRPRPGLVRLHAYRMRPFFGPAEARTVVRRWRQLHRYQVESLSLGLNTVRATGVVRPFPGSEVPWGFPDGLGVDSLSSLDFSSLDAWIGDLLLSGVHDFAVIVPPGSSLRASFLRDGETFLHTEGELSSWFWQEFAKYLFRKGFRNLCVVYEQPLEGSDVDHAWYQSAMMMSESGWSVCGPYAASAVRGIGPGRLRRVSRLLLLDKGAADAYPELLRGNSSLAAPSQKGGLWWSYLDTALTHQEATRYAWQAWEKGARVVALHSVHGPKRAEGRAADPASGAARPAQITDSLAWGGLRDGLDEVNYRAVLEWYLTHMPASEARSKALRRMKAGHAPGAIGLGRGESKKDLLALLSSLREDATRVTRRLYWNNLVLVRGEKALVEIVAEPQNAAQMDQAGLLAEIIEMLTNVSVAVVPAGQFSHRHAKPVVVLLGTEASNSAVAMVLSGRESRAEELGAQLRASGYLIEEIRPYSSRDPRYILLMGAGPEQLGRAVLSFKTKLRCEGAWLLP